MPRETGVLLVDISVQIRNKIMLVFYFEKFSLISLDYETKSNPKQHVKNLSIEASG